MKLYRTGKWQDSVEVVECEKATDKSVFLVRNGGIRREARSSEFSTYHDSEELAAEYLKGRLRRQIDSLKRQLSQAEVALSKLERGR